MPLFRKSLGHWLEDLNPCTEEEWASGSASCLPPPSGGVRKTSMASTTFGRVCVQFHESDCSPESSCWSWTSQPRAQKWRHLLCTPELGAHLCSGNSDCIPPIDDKLGVLAMLWGSPWQQRWMSSYSNCWSWISCVVTGLFLTRIDFRTTEGMSILFTNISQSP